MDIYLYPIGGRTNVQNLLNSYVLKHEQVEQVEQVVRNSRDSQDSQV